MTDTLERFLVDLRFDVPAGLAERAKAAALDPVEAPPSGRRAAHRRRASGGQRQSWAPALVAVLLAVAVVAALVGVRALHPMTPAPAKHGFPITLHHNGYLVVADGSSLVAIDPSTGSRQTLLSAALPLSDPAYSSDGSKLAYLQGGSSIRVLDSASGHIAEVTTCSCGTSSQLTWSPDGSRLAYTNDYQPTGSEIDVIDADGAHRTQLTHFPKADFPWEPSWSPDGTRIAFAMRDSGGIAVMNADGSGLKIILAGNRLQSSAGGSADTPEWSPDGSRIAYVWDPGTSAEYQLWAMNPDGSHRTKIWASPPCCVTAEGGPAWSPDATRIATVTFNTLWVMNADGSNPQSLGTVGTGQRPTWQPEPIVTLWHNGSVVVSYGNGLIAIDTADPRLDHPIVTVPTGEEVSDAAYTRDGTRLAYINGGGSIWVLDTTTGLIKELTTCHCPIISHVSWSPDGSRLAFTDADSNGAFQLFVIGADGMNRSQLTYFAQKTPSQPSWSPDGTRIAFRTEHEIDVIKPDQSNKPGPVTLLTDADGPWDPAWSPDGSKIAYVVDPRSPQAKPAPFEYQLWVMNADGSHRTEIFTSPGCCITGWGGPAWSPDGTRIAIVALPPLAAINGDYWTLWVMNADGSRAQTLPGYVVGDRPTWQPIP
ncbi:MAG: hypothetical protein ACHQ0J_01415 [Candidatus Dormibacterales bacterium]